MNNWKDKLNELHKGGSIAKRKCIECGKEFVPKKEHHKICFDCAKKKNGVGKPTEGLPPQYLEKLEKGYFDNNGCLREEFLTEMASEVAKSFGTKLKNHQLRRFYGHIKAADNRLKMTGDWQCVNLDVKKLSSFVAEAKGKDKVPDSFYRFIEANIKTIHNQKDFEAFVEHFQAIVAYFTYHYPKNN
jgi:CRISPR-associated protein Csm2